VTIHKPFMGVSFQNIPQHKCLDQFTVLLQIFKEVQHTVPEVRILRDSVVVCSSDQKARVCKNDSHLVVSDCPVDSSICNSANDRGDKGFGVTGPLEKSRTCVSPKLINVRETELRYRSADSTYPSS